MEKVSMMRLVVLILFLIGSMVSFSQEAKRLLERGNEFFDKGEYEKAIEQYDKALELDPNYYQAQFNKGDALYRSEKYADAIQEFEKVTAEEIPDQVKSSAFHNIGNAQLNAEKYEEAVEAYKKSLRLNPEDLQTRRNLSYAQKQLLQQKQQQDQQDQKGDDKDDKKEKENKNENKQDDKQGSKDQQNEQDKKDSEDQKDNQKNKDGDQDQNKKDQQKDKPGEQDDKKGGQDDQTPRKEQPKGMSKQDAERLLEALNEDEKKTQQKVQRVKVKQGNSTIEKDW